MNKKLNISLAVVALIVLVASAVAGYEYSQNLEEGIIFSDGHHTNNMMIYESGEPKADEMMVGVWQCVEKPQWYKAYYDDYDQKGYFWGKEWDEAEDIMEEDLTYHGNGWFRWNKTGKELIELSTMEIVDVGIKKEYIIKQKDRSTFSLTEKYYKEKVFNFRRVE